MGLLARAMAASEMCAMVGVRKAAQEAELMASVGARQHQAQPQGIGASFSHCYFRPHVITTCSS